jgi:hypothetical protein
MNDWDTVDKIFITVSILTVIAALSKLAETTF